MRPGRRNSFLANCFHDFLVELEFRIALTARAGVRADVHLIKRVRFLFALTFYPLPRGEETAIGHFGFVQDA
jgi:hypothetical protein